MGRRVRKHNHHYWYFFLLWLVSPSFVNRSKSSTDAIKPVLHYVTQPVRDDFDRKGTDCWISTAVYGSGFASLLQATTTLWKQSTLFDELIRRMLSPERIQSFRKIRSIISDVHEKHGVVDILKNYPARVVLSAMFALNRLQEATRNANEALQQPFNRTREQVLLQDLSRYAAFASAAYGWKLEFALRGKLHGRGDLEALLTRTGLSEVDVVQTVWEAEQSRPAYFIVRDHNRSSIVLSIRGTFSLDDLLTDLCCTKEDLAHSAKKSTRKNSLMKKVKTAVFGDQMNPPENPMAGHVGMLDAASSLRDEVEPILEAEIASHPGYSLVIVGHSLGGGVASLLGTLMEETFQELYVYAYGPPCVVPSHTKLHKNVVSVVAEGDPFRCLSLGHIAGMSETIAELCEDASLRKDILERANNRQLTADEGNISWCIEKLEELRSRIKAEKLLPPGRILYVSEARPSRRFPLPFTRRDRQILLSEVPPRFFQDMFVPTVFDLSNHSPASYEASLSFLVDDISASESATA